MLVSGKASPVPKKRTTSSAITQNRVGITSNTATTTSARPVVTIKSPQASPGNRSAQTQQTTTTTASKTSTSGLASARRPVLQPKETHASRALAAKRAAESQQSAATAAANNARSGSASARNGSVANTARSGSATARSGSATARSSSANTKHQDPSSTSAPFHRPNLASLHHSRTAATAASKSKPVAQRMTSATSARSGSATSTGSAANKRSSSANSTNSAIGARGGIARTPSPVTIKNKRCKHCSALVSNLEQHMMECQCAPIECNMTDSEDHKTTCGFVARGHKHLAEHQKNECALRLVDCRNSEIGCTDQVSFSSMERHVEQNCLFAVMLCEYCKNPVTRGHHEAHVSTECPAVKVLCPLGCGRDILRSELTAHIRDQWSDAAHPRNSKQDNSSSAATRLMPPESARRVAETLLGCLEAATQQKESETILAPSDEIDSPLPIGGDVNSVEHALFVGQSVSRSISRLEKYVSANEHFSAAFAQNIFELVERRTEAAKQRLKPFAAGAENKMATTLKNHLETSLAKVALAVSVEES